MASERTVKTTIHFVNGAKRTYMLTQKQAEILADTGTGAAWFSFGDGTAFSVCVANITWVDYVFENQGAKV